MLLKCIIDLMYGKKIIKNAKKRDNSWDKPAKRYKELYQRLIEG